MPARNAFKNFSMPPNAALGWFYNDPAFREAEAALRERFGRTLAETRRRLAAAGVTDPQAVARAEAPLRIHFASQFRSLYSRQAEIERRRREERRAARRTLRSRLVSAIVSLGTRGLIQAALNRQRYHHQRSLNVQRAELGRNPYPAETELLIPAYGISR